MKTKIRFSHKVNYIGKKEIHCQILDNSEYSEVIGYLIFTKFSEDRNFIFTNAEVNSDDYDKFQQMAKIIKKIKENCCYDSDILECMNVVNYEEYTSFNMMFVSVLDHGKFIYGIYSDNEKTKLYKKFVAKNEMDAIKYINKNFPQYSGSYNCIDRITVKSNLFAEKIYQIN